MWCDLRVSGRRGGVVQLPMWSNSIRDNWSMKRAICRQRCSMVVRGISSRNSLSSRLGCRRMSRKLVPSTQVLMMNAPRPSSLLCERPHVLISGTGISVCLRTSSIVATSASTFSSASALAFRGNRTAHVSPVLSKRILHTMLYEPNFSESGPSTKWHSSCSGWNLDTHGQSFVRLIAPNLIAQFNFTSYSSSSQYSFRSIWTWAWIFPCVSL